MKAYKKVIFISLNGTCRAPLVSGIFNQKLKNDFKINDIIVEARGLVVLFEEPPNPKAVAVASSKGLDLTSYTSSLLDELDFDEDTLMLCMSEQNKKKIYDEYQNALNVYTIKEFVEESGDVEAPYGKELPDYADTYASLERLADKIIEKIIERNN